MLACLAPLQSQAQDWDSLLFAVYYHDLIYDVTRYMTENDNEDRSAEAAEDFLKYGSAPTNCRQVTIKQSGRDSLLQVRGYREAHE